MKFPYGLSDFVSRHVAGRYRSGDGGGRNQNERGGCKEP